MSANEYVDNMEGLDGEGEEIDDLDEAEVDEDEHDEFEDEQDGEVNDAESIPNDGDTDEENQNGLIAYIRQSNHMRYLFEFGRSRAEDMERPGEKRFPPVPSAYGQKLRASGDFGASDWSELPSRRALNHKGLLMRRLDQELGLGGAFMARRRQQLMMQSLVPSPAPEMVIHYEEPVTCGQYSDDGHFFTACGKDLKVRMYDTSDMYNWRHYKTVEHPIASWTLTDAALTPDNRFVAFSSLQNHVCLAPTDPHDKGLPYTLDLSGRDPHAPQAGRFRDNFGIFSLRFSGDGRTLVAGTTGYTIVVYDIESRRVLSMRPAHGDDVNAVCFASKKDPHVLFSGSDDCTIRMWDTRCPSNLAPAGIFVGHTQGLTYIDSKGDGRYILSNGKDQSMKLWDVRKAMSQQEYTRKDAGRPTQIDPYDFDYRWQIYEEDRYYEHPHDNSVVTMRGHRVGRSLIRCHFAPPQSADSRYLYSGSSDGCVYIWDVDATLVRKMDVMAATRNARIGPLDGAHRYHPHHARRRPFTDGDDDWQTMVRDVSWHPSAPVLVASAWTGPSMNQGTLTMHSWNEEGAQEDDGEPIMGRWVDEKMVEEPEYEWPHVPPGCVGYRRPRNMFH